MVLELWCYLRAHCWGICRWNEVKGAVDNFWELKRVNLDCQMQILFILFSWPARKSLKNSKIWFDPQNLKISGSLALKSSLTWLKSFFTVPQPPHTFHKSFFNWKLLFFTIFFRSNYIRMKKFSNKIRVITFFQLIMPK